MKITHLAAIIRLYSIPADKEIPLADIVKGFVDGNLNPKFRQEWIATAERLQSSGALNETQLASALYFHWKNGKNDNVTLSDCMSLWNNLSKSDQSFWLGEASRFILESAAL